MINGQWCFDKCVRIDWILPVDCCVGDGTSPCDLLEEFFEEHDDDELAEIFGRKFIKSLRAYEDDGSEVGEAFVEALSRWNLSGFLVNVSRPVHEPSADGSSNSYSWGHLNPRTFFVPDLDDSLTSAIEAWCAERKKSEAARAEKKAQSSI